MGNYFRKFLTIFLTIILLISPFSETIAYTQDSVKIVNVNDLSFYDDVSGKDLSSLDLKAHNELILTLTYDTFTLWPSNDKMPVGYDSQKILEWGKDSGLGIKKLQGMGYTGKGVNIAYIDQPLLGSHNEYKDRSVIYTKINGELPWMATSMHGPAVLSLLAGRNIGIAPESTVYYFAHQPWLRDQLTHAEALRKLIEVNKSLPVDKKIRIAGFSDGPDSRESNKEEYEKAIIEAENNDIMVIDVLSRLNILPLEITYPNDKNDYNNYKVANWAANYSNSTNLYVPTSGRTTANGYDVNQYTYWANGGLSWAIPYVVGTITLGLQVDSSLTKANAEKYLAASAYLNDKGLKVINPEGFLKLVRQNATTISPNAPKYNYYYVLYNSKKVDDKDLSAIKEYASGLDNAILKDVSSYNNANAIYDMLKTDSKTKDGILKGIQIFGSAPSNASPSVSGDVPSFNIGFKIQMEKAIDDMGLMNTDFFYSTFKNESSMLNQTLSLYGIFNEKLNVYLIPEWPVARVPLNKGEIAPYLTKYKEYASKTKDQVISTVNFSSPIFASSSHQDDMGYFIRQRLDKEFGIINSKQYRLYGNLDGIYPVQTEVLGNVTKENIQKENEKEISTFFINGHGQAKNIDRSVFDTNNKEQRISFMNTENINSLLNKNYYNMILWTCNNAYDLRNDSLVHQAMVGNAVNVLASTTILSNNGVDNTASLENLKKNNFYYFQYVYFANYYKLSKSMSDSFFEAQKAYTSESLKHTDMLGEGNYQFNLNNALQFHYFGVLEKSAVTFNTFAEVSTPPSFNGDIIYSGSSNGSVKIDSFKVQRVGNSVEFTLNYASLKNCDYSFFNPPDGDKIKKLYMGEIKKGTNVTKFTLNMDEFKKVLSVDRISMIFGFDDNANWISFNTSQLTPLLNTGIIAKPTTSRVLINGHAIAFDAYNINGNNYFKLRDLAMALNHSNKQFEISWDATQNAINLLTGESYSIIGGELSLSGSTANKVAAQTTSSVFLNGRQVPLAAYNINGYNYFKLRDVGSKIDFNVSWSNSLNTITIDTETSYN